MERDQGIEEIQNQVVEVNEIFKDLAVLVDEQGTVIGECIFNLKFYFKYSCCDFEFVK